MATADYNSLDSNQIKRSYYRNKLIAFNGSYASDNSLLYGDNAQVTYLDLVNKGTIIEANSSVGIAGLPAGTVIAVTYSGTWPARPTSRTDIIVEWVGPNTAPTNNAFINGDRRLFTP